MTRILVTGANGQLGFEIRKIAKDFPKKNFIFVDKEELPLENTNAIDDFLNGSNPDIIISAGAYTAVDKAESERELSEQVNYFAIKTISKWCTVKGAKLIHISTDYVFDGTSKTPYKEVDKTSPINWYGETKLKGEQAITSNSTNAVIIRTSWLYSEHGNNFVKKMLRLISQRSELSVVSDQIGSPTYALDLAKTIMIIVESKDWKPGIYHYSNLGALSWYDFAIAIADISKLKCQIKAVRSDQFPTAALRPNYSLLDKEKISFTYALRIPKWKDSLKECLKILNQKK
jgi:dTDP-4-dehydrorhamnose reductase